MATVTVTCTVVLGRIIAGHCTPSSSSVPVSEATSSPLALALGTTVSYVKYLDAQEEADKARKARDFLVSIFRVAETDSLGGNITARQILAYSIVLSAFSLVLWPVAHTGLLYPAAAAVLGGILVLRAVRLLRRRTTPNANSRK